MHKWWQNVLFFLMYRSLKFICYLHYQCHIIYYNHFLNLTIKANITVSYTPLFVGPSGDSSICSSLSAMEWVMEFCWAVEGGMRMKGHGLRVLKTKLSGYMGALVFHSRALLSPLLLSLSLVPSSPSLSVCDSRGLWAAEVSAGRQRGDCVSALSACVSCKRSPLWQEQPSHFIWV